MPAGSWPGGKEVSVSDLAATTFPAGSMGPKVEAVCEFVHSTGKRAAIGSLDEVFEQFFQTEGAGESRRPCE